MHSILTISFVLYSTTLSVMRKVQKDGGEHTLDGKYTYEDTHILEDTHSKNIEALEEIIGVNASGDRQPTETSKKLRKLGKYWSQHVLEGVHSWILVFCYILGTVISGYPLVSGIAVTIEPGISRTSSILLMQILAYAFATLDALIYVFSPQWCCLLLRILEGRPLWHRMTGRSVVIGDIPWVAQSIEAYVSKLFACSYSAAGLTGMISLLLSLLFFSTLRSTKWKDSWA